MYQKIQKAKNQLLSDSLMKRIAVVTTGRQDWGILRNICEKLCLEPTIDVRIIAGGIACSEKFGRIIDDIVADGFSIDYMMDWLKNYDEMPTVLQTSRAIEETSDAIKVLKPDCLLLLGDRFETAAAALAATLSCLPIVHVGGGFETVGAFDNSLRHAITKMSSLHFVSTLKNATSVIQMGENPKSVYIVGSAGLDSFRRDDLAKRDELEDFLNIKLKNPLIIVTYHPTTLGYIDSKAECKALLSALNQFDATYVFTLPNNDPGSQTIRQMKINFAQHHVNSVTVQALGQRKYLGLLKLADAVVGNSSSAIIEAPVIKKPVVNIGDRQKGREKSTNIIDVPPTSKSIYRGLKTALSKSFQIKSKNCQSYHGDGYTSSRIASILGKWTPPDFPRKNFYGIEGIDLHISKENQFNNRCDN